jgi:Flp pilus assembly protein TadB
VFPSFCGGTGVAGWLVMLLLWGGLIAAVLWGIAWLSPQRPAASSLTGPVDRVRLATRSRRPLRVRRAILRPRRHRWLSRPAGEDRLSSHHTLEVRMHGTHMRYLLVAAGGLVVGLLVAGTSVQALLPFLLLLACPLMMVFMMRGMGGLGGGHSGERAQDRDDTTAGRP